MNETAQTTGQGTVCPSCNRFVGAYDRCPFCGTSVPKRISLRALRYISLLVAITGVVCLHLMAMYRDIPTVKIGDISPAMNFGYKRIIARASQPLRFYSDGDKITGCMLAIEDDSGELRVRAFRPVAEELARRGISIRKGDRISVAGTLQVMEDAPRMLLQSPDQLEILESAHILDLALGELGGISEVRPVRVKASVEQIIPPRSERAPYRIVLRDGTGSGNLIVWPQQFDDIPEEHRPLPGSLVDVRATASFYRGAPQLQLDDPRDLIRLAQASVFDAAPAQPPAPPLTPLADISSADIGRSLRIAATIADIRAPAQGSRAPYTVTLQDGPARQTLVFWQDVYDRLPNPAALAPGSRLQATVSVAEFRGRLQLQVRNATQLTLLPSEAATQPSIPSIPSTSPAPPAPAQDPAAVNTAPVGTQLSIQGRVVSLAPAASERSPYRLTLSGDGGTATVVIWSDAWQQIPETLRPTTGMLIRVSGQVGEFKQFKELRVRRGSDVQPVN